MKYAKIEKLLRQSPRGFTINNRNGDRWNGNGYAVSLTNHRTTKNNLTGVVKSINRLSRLLSDKLFYGGWRDGKTLYLDCSYIVENKRDALAIAKLYNQKAIFDFRTKQTIKV